MRTCGNDLLKKLSQENLRSKRFPKAIPPTSVKIVDIPTNPYCSAITGIYAFDITKISDFKIYFFKSTDDPAVNECISSVLSSQSASAVDWPETFQSFAQLGINSHANLIGGTTTIVDTYDESDWVCVLMDQADFLGACYGPAIIAENPTFVDGRVVLFLDNQDLTDDNLQPGSYNFITLIHEAGHGFGLAHPHDDGFGSTIMPAIYTNTDRLYPSIGGYAQNTIFTTVMSYNDTQFFLPEPSRTVNNSVGYSFTLMPLDIVALKWMYNIDSVSNTYANTYGLSVVKIQTGTSNQTQTIMGKNRKISFSNTCGEIAFYFTKNTYSPDNLSPINYTYNRVLGRQWSFYPMETDASVSNLVLGNTTSAYLFVEKEGIRTNVLVTVRCNICNIYVNNDREAYTFQSEFIFTEKSTGKKFTVSVENPDSTVNIYFNK